MMNQANKMQQYASVGVQTSIMDADPHRLIQLLYQGALDSMAKAKGSIAREDINERNTHINKAIQIVGGLKSFLDKEKGGELAVNLERLYDYVEFRLFEANLNNDPAALDETAKLIREVKSGWDEIRGEAVEFMNNGSNVAVTP